MKFFHFLKSLPLLFLLFFNSLFFLKAQQEKEAVLHLGVIGLVHDHVNWIFNRQKPDIKIVGIVETNPSAISKYKKRYQLADSLFFESYEALYRSGRLDAVSAFNPTQLHLEVVNYFAPKKIPIMVEKPMAASYEDALKMADLAEKYQVPLLVNYETSWYESTYEAKTLLDSGRIGSLTKMVFNTGHPGPKEIGCSPEFLAWLTDPILNGGGALTDFGCYGANIATWLLKGQTPLRVSCVAKQSKPLVYPKVDDDTTIVLDYSKHQVVIQASWNWSHNRKDMQIYGSQGYIDNKNASQMYLMEREIEGEKVHLPPAIPPHLKDPFRLLYEVVFYDFKLPRHSLYSVENNLIVNKILSLAGKAAKTQKTQNWD